MGINRATAKATGRRWPTTIRCHQHIFAVIEPASASYQQPGHHRADDNRRDLDPIPDDLRFHNPAAAVHHMTGYSCWISCHRPANIVRQLHCQFFSDDKHTEPTCFNTDNHGFTLSKATLDVLLLTFKRCDINACR